MREMSDLGGGAFHALAAVARRQGAERQTAMCKARHGLVLGKRSGGL
jgi:hypothetical protein